MPVGCPGGKDHSLCLVFTILGFHKVPTLFVGFDGRDFFHLEDFHIVEGVFFEGPSKVASFNAPEA